jgi:hypothetical protein
MRNAILVGVVIGVAVRFDVYDLTVELALSMAAGARHS